VTLLGLEMLQERLVVIILNSANDTSGRTITVIDDDFYSYSVGLSASATFIFGGGRATSGPVTISP
jgi:hypothetical protein